MTSYGNICLVYRLILVRTLLLFTHKMSRKRRANDAFDDAAINICTKRRKIANRFEKRHPNFPKTIKDNIAKVCTVRKTSKIKT